MYTDLKYALRQLVKNPGFTLVVVLSLAIAIGVSTAIFGLVNNLIFRSLPVRDPDSLVTFGWLASQHGNHPLGSSNAGYGQNDRDSATGESVQRNFSFAVFQAFEADHALLEDVFAFGGLSGIDLSIDDVAETLDTGRLVSGRYFQALGVNMLRGRSLLPEDDQAGAAPAAVISYDFWLRRFGRDPAAIGKTISVNRVPVVIVGVTPPDFIGSSLSNRPADLTLPLSVATRVSLDGANANQPGNWWLSIMGRLRPGVAAAQAQASLDRSFDAGARGGISNPDDPPHLRLSPGGKGRTQADREHNALILSPMVGMVVLILLTTCANSANLLLARGAARRHEIAVRLALGASRGRIVRQLLTESMLLAVFGAALGLLISHWGIGLIGILSPPEDKTMFEHLVVDWRALSFTIGLTILVGVGFGLAPALRATRLNLNAEFQGGKSNLGAGGRTRLNRALLIGQVGLAVVLLVLAGLFVRTERNLRQVALGFNNSNLLLFSLNGQPAGYTRTQFSALYSSVAEGIRSVPGVRSAAYSGWPLASNFGWPETSMISVPGLEVPTKRKDDVTFQQVGPDFFETYQIPILLGRGIGLRDDASASNVAVVNQAFAEKYLAHTDPIGRAVVLLNVNRVIVGVAADMKETSLRERTSPTIFVPFAQQPQGPAYFAVRTIGAPAGMAGAVRTAIGETDRRLPLGNLRTGDEQMGWDLSGERIYAILAASLGLLALGLVCVGLYGLMSYLVLRRTSEIGLRMALGALPRQVLWMILGESLALVGTGIGCGLVASFGVSRLISALLYGLTASDFVTYLAAAALLTIVALIACMMPARRAAGIDPVVALRME